MEKPSAYTTTNIDRGLDEAQLNAEIKRAKQEMEKAAKSLDFAAAARHRDRMYEYSRGSAIS